MKTQTIEEFKRDIAICVIDNVTRSQSDKFIEHIRYNPYVDILTENAVNLANAVADKLYDDPS